MRKWQLPYPISHPCRGNEKTDNISASSDPSPCILVCSLGWMWVYACSHYGLNSLHYSLSIWICFEFELEQWCFRVFLEHRSDESFYCIVECFANYVGPQFYKTNVMFFLRVTNAIPFISSKAMNVIQVCLLISLCLTCIIIMLWCRYVLHATIFLWQWE